MVNRLAHAVSPYLRSHAENPVDWYEWGAEPFAEAARRQVPVLVSIGYSTCHWCHVMARESFSDAALAAHLNANFVAIKVDREEYPDVDSSYLAAAGAFTGQLGWPLNVFVTPEGKTFFAGTYWPPRPMQGHPAFRQILDAVTDAWQNRREEVESNASAVASALAAQGEQAAGELPTPEAWSRVIRELAGYEDREFGGFGGAPKFPVSPVLLLLLDRGSLAANNPASSDSADAAALAERTLTAMADSELRDEVEGGFFRYSTMRDWTDPHYERMLYDNAMLLGAYSRLPNGLPIAEGIAGFLASVLRVPGGAFASAQDSESTVDGERVEGGYYRLDAAARARQTPPALDDKVLTGWNGLAIETLADAGFRHGRDDWIALARDAADYLLQNHLRADGTLVRASIGAAVSAAKATLEDYGMFASGLLRLALATGEVSYARAARNLVDAVLGDESVFRVPGGADPVLESHGLALGVDPSEGAYPSGTSAMAGAAHTLYLLTADARYLRVSVAAMELFAPMAVPRPISFGASLAVMTRLQAPSVQLVVVSDAAGASAAGAPEGAAAGDGNGDAAAGTPGTADASVTSVARGWQRAGSLTAIVTTRQAAAFAQAGFELFEGRTALRGAPTAYLCRDFVCRLPLTAPDELALQLE